MSTLRVKRLEGERGAFIVLWAILLVALMTMVAIVIDLGDARSTRRTDQSVADFAALAASDNLGVSPTAACADAFGYVKGNLPDFPSAGVTSPCNVAGSPGGTAFPTTCGSGTTAQDFVATGTGPYTVTFRYPVTPSDIVDNRFSGTTGVNDGTPCERFKVTVAKTRRSFFSGVVNEFVRTTRGSAVMRSVSSPGNRIPSLWLLDPAGCVALDASGGSDISVGDATHPGLITVDSDGTGSGCSSTKQTMDASGSGTQIHALPSSGDPAGQIQLYAMPPGSTSCQQSQCDQGDVSSGRVSPQPEPSDVRATRAPADYRWNCKSTTGSVSPDPVAGTAATYVDGSTSAYPNYHVSDDPIKNCGNAAYVQPYIDKLKSQVGPSGKTLGNFSQWTTSPGHSNSCSPKGPQVIPAGTNMWIDCPSGFSLGTGDSVTFLGGNVVFDGDITLNGSSVLTVNSVSNTGTLSATCAGSFQQINNLDSNVIDTSNPPTLDAAGNCMSSSSSAAAYMYQRSGDLNLGGGTFNLFHTALYQASGSIKTTGGSPASWSNPTTGPFKGLALWSEKSDAYTLNGGGSLLLSGTYFAPEANTFKLTGGGGSSLLSAQFIAYRLEISGGGTLNLVPSQSNNISTPKPKGVLIR